MKLRLSQRRLILICYPIFLGLAPIFGKMAIRAGADPFTLAALRTVVAAGILWVVYLLFARKYIFVYPAGLLGCIVVGTVNGIGSLFYYNGLSRLDASVAQLLNATYLIFVIVLSFAGGQRLSGRDVLRASLALLAVTLITQGVSGRIDWLGTGLMLGNAILFAATFVLGQRVTYEMPSPTVALYVLTTMAVIVVAARVIYRMEWIPQHADALAPIIALGISTALARLAMFFGLKRLGPTQTVLIGISEAGVTLLLAFVLLGDSLTGVQWVGVGVLMASLLLIRRQDLDKLKTGEIPLFVAMQLGRATTQNFNRIAFRKAFGGKTQVATLDEISVEDMRLIERMMSAPARYESPREMAAFARQQAKEKEQKSRKEKKGKR
ncbi:MAG TPA: DMT family transporter [Aggregatilineales bacterium]|nr:DMT family transporter [Anaerolineales bacterium]HRE47777.1 DMT family transporter [Aggregatilineales bacterium]